MVVQLLAAASSNGGGSLAALALPVLMIVGFYFLLIRPQRTRQRAQQALLASLEVGDEVLTTGGIFGTVLAIDDDEGVVTVEIAPGTKIRMVRQGISQRFVEDDDVQDEDQGGAPDEEPERQP